MKEWRSVKKFSDEKVSRETVEELMFETTKAPTAFNLQPYRFLIIESDTGFEKISESLVPGNEWVLEADKIALLIGYEDFTRNLGDALDDMHGRGEIGLEEMKDLRERINSYRERGEVFVSSWINRNTMFPAVFFMKSCQNRGIGTCPVRGFSQEKVSEHLDLEADERPVLLIPFGYPEKEGERHWRREAKEIFDFV